MQNQSELSIVVLVGTGRRGAASVAVARHLATEVFALRMGVRATYQEVGSLLRTCRTVPAWEGGPDHPQVWCELAQQADGFVFVIPEYNHGYPGEWKLLIDSCDPEVYRHKPVVLCGVSAGPFGGRAVVDHATPVVATLGMLRTQRSMYIPEVQERVREGVVHFTERERAEFIDPAVEELLQLARTCRSVRQA